jgi:hypothetical protein
MSTITPLQLGAVLSTLIDNANKNFDLLAEEVKGLIDMQGKRAYVYNTVDDMVSTLKAGTDDKGNPLKIDVGDEIYILEDDAPDFWVSSSNATGEDNEIPSSWENGTTYKFGKYEIRVSGAGTIDLQSYQKISELAKTINGISPSRTNAPSEFAVWNLVKDFIGNSEFLANTTASYTTNKDLLLQSIPDDLEAHESAINSNRDRIEDIEESIKNGTVGGTITVSDLKSDYIDIKKDSSDYWTKVEVGNVENWCIIVEKTNTALGIFKYIEDHYEEIIVQKTIKKHPTTGEDVLYIIVGETKFDCQLRKLSGGVINTGGSGGSIDEETLKSLKNMQSVLRALVIHTEMPATFTKKYNYYIPAGSREEQITSSGVGASESDIPFGTLDEWKIESFGNVTGGGVLSIDSTGRYLQGYYSNPTTPGEDSTRGTVEITYKWTVVV